MNIYKCFGACSVKISMFALALGLAACGGENSTSAPSNNLSEDEKNVTDKASWEYLNPEIAYGTLTDDRDGQVYRTVTIGTQTWMAENLNYAYTGVPYEYDGDSSNSTSWCRDNDPANCAKYGRLYTWSAAMDSAGIVDSNGVGKGCGVGNGCIGMARGVCPSGWHLPSYDEFETLIKYVDPDAESYGHIGNKHVRSSTAANRLKSKFEWDSVGVGLDTYGFSAISSGITYDPDADLSFYYAPAQFWSNDGNSREFAYSLIMYNNDETVVNWHAMSSAISVRCVKDSSSVTSSSSVASSSSSSVIPGTDPGSPVYGTLTDIRDNQVYKTVTIGTQTWMAENLNYAYTEPPFDVDYDTTGLCFLGDYCNGRLYTWAAAMDSASLVNSSGTGETVRGVCPSGWHLPSKKEWETLWDVCEVGDMTFTRMPVIVNHCSEYLKTSSILAGGNYAQFWSSTEEDEDRALRWYPLHDGYAIVSKNEKSSLFAVRCVQD
ncbi:MAG: hypothetical protein MJZ05_09840 [Fibrobacter sp.]|nr:hypothetical protein [Fibrobacter sp.]